jgi:UDP-3-O-[3-hydroxymyristoyl] N-acetylglucosamine deacetylase
MERLQTTLRRSVRFAGVGLHCGRTVQLEIAPAAPGAGIAFERTDLPRSKAIAATVANIQSSELCTTIGRGVASVSTVEHLMAAFAGLGIDNAVVRVDAPEMPILDGSAAPFVDKMLAAGIARIEGRRKLLMVKDVLEIRDGAKLMRIEPAEALTFECAIEFPSRAIGRQALTFGFSRSSFLDLCASRTFCHADDVARMRAAGLALGGSLDNAVVVTDTGVVNPEGLRCPDEFVRHKLLDCIGDLALLGAPLVGKVTLERPGHALHGRFMQELVRRRDELLTVVELGSFRAGDRILPDHAAAVAAAAIYG